MGYVNTLAGLGLMPWQTDAIKRAQETVIESSSRGFLFPVIDRSISPSTPVVTSGESRRALFDAAAQTLPSYLDRISEAAGSFIRRVEPTIKPLVPRLPANSLRPVTVSLPIPRHNDPTIRPLEPAAVIPALASEPAQRPVIGKPAPSIFPVRRDTTTTRGGELVSASEAIVQRGADAIRSSYHTDWSGDTTGLTIREPGLPGDVIPSSTGLQFTEATALGANGNQVEQAQTFLDAAKLPPIAKYGLIALGLLFFFGSAKKAKRNPCLRG